MPADRRHPIIPFDAARFRPFFGEELADARHELLPGGACNSNYLVTTADGGRFVCRIHARGDPAREKRVLGLVDGAAPVPQYLWVGEGVSVMAFIYGGDFEPTPSLMRQAGEIIGRFARVRFDASGEIGADGEVRPHPDWPGYARGLLGLLDLPAVEAFLGLRRRDAVRSLIERERAVYEAFDACRNLVHGDFKPDNILVDKGRIVGVLDWEFSHSGCSFADIANLLRQYPSGWEAHLAAGLRQEGFALPEDWRYRAYLADLASHLEFLTSGRSIEFKRTCVARIDHLLGLDGGET